MARSGSATSFLTEEETTANAQAIDALVKSLGGRDGMLETLAVAADAPEVEQVVNLLLDPRYARHSIRALCHMAGLTIVDLFAALKQAMVTKAHLQAYKAITDGILPVVEDVMKRAAPFEIPCYGCNGRLEVEDPEDPTRRIACGQCNGHGKLLQLPDLDRQKLALELGQLVQKSAGFSIQQNTVNLPPGASGGDGKSAGTLVDLQHAVRELLSGPRQPILDEPPAVEPIEGEVVDAPEPAWDPVTGRDPQRRTPEPSAASASSTPAAPIREAVPVDAAPRAPQPDPIPALGSFSA